MRTVHQTIDSHRNEILRLWVQAIRESTFAQELSPSELAGIMPDYLGSLGQIALDRPLQLQDRQQDLLERHMLNRLRQGSTLNEILSEFSALSRILAWFIDRDSERDSATRDVAGLFAELQLAVIASMKIFNEHLLEDEQPINRYLRLLQNLAGSGDTLLRSPQPLRLLVKEALSLIGQSIDAGTLALFLIDAESNRIALSASAGDAADLLEEQVRSLEGQLDDATAPGDGFHEIAPNDQLRAAGINSLLAVRLTSRHVFRGILYVGGRDGRRFTAGEVRQIEALGEALTLHLDHAQLCAALRVKAHEAVAECQLRERFVSMLMHDLSGPLASARALVQPGAPLDQEVASKVVREIDRMEEMVDGLLDAHRIRAGHALPMNIARCDLGGLVGQAVEELRAAHGDRFIFEADGGVCGMWSADQLRRAVWNLASNAIKFGAPDAPVLIAVRRAAAAAEVVVHNDGPPIPVGEQAELFRPFSLPHAGRGHPPGWGLGLTLVWGCAEAHGGHVEVASGFGRGTTFTLAIPYDARPYAE